MFKFKTRENHNSKLHYLFGESYPEWHYVRKFLSFVTPYSVSLKVAMMANDHYGLDKKRTVMWDMFSGIGSDCVNFGKYCNLIGTEIDEETFSCLKKNTAKLSNVTVFNMDCCKYEDDDIDIVYFDPPWGDSFVSGEEFNFEDVKLDSNGTSVMDIADKIVTKYGNVIIKSPITSNSFEKRFDDKIKERYIFPKQKVKVLFLSSD